MSGIGVCRNPGVERRRLGCHFTYYFLDGNILLPTGVVLLPVYSTGLEQDVWCTLSKCNARAHNHPPQASSLVHEMLLYKIEFHLQRNRPIIKYPSSHNLEGIQL